ncbi:metallophosphoesterase [Microlunatus speluncae]|uniref:metallophosphoesterase n=1 Tax=Microlunatus speluncae TaxID=2594267 RepID=UPI001266414D|nr:metallophosphoesterase [Microlunatus speluncae]
MDGDGGDDASGDDLPLLSFGVVADCQYAANGNSAPHPVRRYDLSRSKLAEAVATFNDHELAFVINLGDLIDSSADDLGPVLEVFRTSRAPVRHSLGNHDLAGFDGDRPAAVRALTMPGPYYSWTAAGHRFVVLDTNRIGVLDLPAGSVAWHRGVEELERRFTAGELNAQPWNGGLDPVQLSWLGRELDRASAAAERVLIFAHQPVVPATDHTVLNANELLAVLARAGSGLAGYLCGHDHAGGLGWIGAAPAVTFVGMVDTELNAYAIVRVYADRMTITGYGREVTRELTGGKR